LHEINDALALGLALVVKVGLVKECNNIVDVSELLLVAGIFRFRDLVLVILEPLRVLTSYIEITQGIVTVSIKKVTSVKRSSL
jgi:hypothetical protein